MATSNVVWRAPPKRLKTLAAVTVWLGFTVLASSGIAEAGVSVRHAIAVHSGLELASQAGARPVAGAAPLRLRELFAAPTGGPESSRTPFHWSRLLLEECMHGERAESRVTTALGGESAMSGRARASILNAAECIISTDGPMQSIRFDVIGVEVIEPLPAIMSQTALQAFFATLGGQPNAQFPTADFDGDGDAGTDADIESAMLFINSLSKNDTKAAVIPLPLSVGLGGAALFGAAIRRPRRLSA
jgi:hypothetical protein